MKPRALIVGDRRKDGVRDGVNRALPYLKRRLDVVGVDLDERIDLEKAEADLLLAFGGDGSFLYVAHRLGTNPIPVLGVNFGRLGYLAELQPEDLEEGIEAYLAGRYRIWDRTRLHCVHHAGGTVRDAGFALNDVVVGRRVLGRMVEIDVRIDGAEAITVAGDGLIVATASGSTAHALSAGGPLVEPSLDAFVLVPICPHALANRPLLVPDTSRIELHVRPEREGAVVVVDGREPTPVAPDDIVVVTDARAPLRVLSVTGRTYYDVLRKKLGWKGRPNYRGVEDAMGTGASPAVHASAPRPAPSRGPLAFQVRKVRTRPKKPTKNGKGSKPA